MNDRAPDQVHHLHDDAIPGVQVLCATVTGHRYRPHAHPTWTLALLHRGLATFLLDGQTRTARPDVPVIIPPGAVHTGEPGPAGYAYISIYLAPELIDAMKHELPGPPVAAAARRLYAAWAEPATVLHRTESVESLSQALSSQRPARAEPSCTTAVRRATELLHERWNEPVTLADLASHAKLSRARLVRVFRAHHGLPPHAYQLNLR
ncbi:MAG: AraC family transcriptional regulator, partial [Actinomycetota bacterium]|nr:AraC family transcriptional regulator [Actinomycetota bacterium]